MSQPPENSPENYVYRRVAPPHYKVKRNWVAPDAFQILPTMRGLSVFRADIATPRQVLQECIEDRVKRLNDTDEPERQKAAAWLAKNPNVEMLIQKEYRVVEIAVAAIQGLGFTRLEGPEPNGHINIVGTAEEFAERAEAFVELLDTGQARILSPDECLKRPDTD